MVGKIDYKTALIVALLVWAVVSTGFAVRFYFESTLCQSGQKEGLISVSIGIDYGNGTISWHNDTVIPKGSNLLSATVLVAKVEYKTSSFGAYVTSINGLAEKIVSKNEGYSWMWYIYDREKGELVLGKVAADKYQLRDGDIVVWKYKHWKA